MTTDLNIRSTDLGSYAQLLQTRQVLKEDFVVPATRLVSENGVLVYHNGVADVDADGVTQRSGRYHITQVFIEGLASRLGVPVGYLKRIHTERPDLFDANVNGWICGGFSENTNGIVSYPADTRNVFFRTFRGEGSENGIARAITSDRFNAIDDYDILVATLKAIKEAGVDLQPGDVQCNLTDRGSYVFVNVPSIAVLAPELLKAYRSPFDNGQRRAGEAGPHTPGTIDNGLGTYGGQPIVSAGFAIRNSEVGKGRYSITPRLVVQICKNGLTVARDAFSKVHLGGQLDEGAVVWSDATRRANLDLIIGQTKDAVSTFLNVEYVRSVVTELEAKSATPVNDPATFIPAVAKKLLFSEQDAAGILNHFILGGAINAGGVVHAFTSYAQTVGDADKAFQLEEKAFEALDLAVAAA